MTTLWGVVMGSQIELSDQEAYYWLWSQTLDWSYFDHPPLQAWLTALSTSIGDNTNLAVRLPAILGRVLFLYFSYLWVLPRAGAVRARAVVLALCSSFFVLAGSWIALPDGVMLPFAVLTMYFCDRKQWLAVGLCLGFAGLGKWTALCLVPGVLASLVFHHGWSRRALLNMLSIGVVAIVIQAPVLWWNLQHDWVSFRFHLYERHQRGPVASTQALLNGIQFLGSQLVLGGTGLALLLWGRFGNPIHKKKDFPLLSWIWPAFLLFGFSALRGEIRFYWTSIAFVPLFLLLVQKTSNGSLLKIERYQFVGATLSLAFLSSIMFLPVGAYLRDWTQRFGKYDLRHSPRGDFAGWRDWVATLDPAWLASGSHAFLANNFRLSSQLAWTTQITDDRIGVADPEQNQFLFRPYPSPDKYTRAVFFADNRRKARFRFNEFCGHPLEWQRFKFQFQSHTIKVITWAECTVYQRPVWAEF